MSVPSFARLPPSCVHSVDFEDEFVLKRADENVPTDNVAVRDVVVELKLLCCRSNTRRVPCLRMAEWMPLAALLKLPASLISFALVVRQASSTIVLWRAVSRKNKK